jgi:hypothetical protein
MDKIPYFGYNSSNTMKIIDIYNLPRKSSFPVEDIFKLKDFGRNIFSIHNNIGADWELLKKNVPGLKGHFIDTTYNKFYIVSLNESPFILVNYDKVMQYFTPYSTNPSLYQTFMRLLIAHSDLSYCHFSAEKDLNILLPDEDGYDSQYED